jgi:hypothetical protein
VDDLIADQFRALYPDELVKRYGQGERDFERINVLRTELEEIGRRRRRQLDVSPKMAERHNPLWADFRSPVDREFEWDAYGHCIPVEYDDLPMRDLRGAHLVEANLEGSYLYPVDLEGANLSHATLRNSIVLDVNLRGADLSYADLRWATVTGDLRDSNLYMTKLQRCSLAGCDLRGADLRRAKLRRASLAGADLRGSALANAHFDETRLIDADLRGVVLDGAALRSVIVDRVRIDDGQQADFLRALRVIAVDAEANQVDPSLGPTT